jgi:polyisoprenoid-binding protein YceI
MRKIVTFSSLLLLASTASADWSLNSSESDFSFSSIKKGTVLESHSFTNFDSQIDSTGLATLSIDLTSVSTGIEIRDERMKSMLFDTPTFGQATFKTQLDPAKIDMQKAGDIVSTKITGTLSLHGIEKELSADVNIIKLTDNKIMVSTAKPIAIKAADFGLDAGVTALKEVAKLPSISFAVPVNFNLTYNK